MMRIKLFGLFIAFALLALVRPRKCLELLEAADNWVGMVRRRALRDSIHHNGAPNPGQVPPRPNPGPPAGDGFYLGPDGEYRNNDGTPFAHPFSAAGVKEMCTQPRCTLPPAGWRCTRRAGHDGPCAAVVK